MKNPLLKRLPREIKNNKGRYIAVFIMLTVVIAFVSGFLVAGESCKRIYNENFEKSNIEDGSFITAFALDQETITQLQNLNLKVYQDSYRDYKDSSATLRLLHNRTACNLIQVMDGKMPEQDNEIALDRLYANYHNIKIGDILKIDGKELNVCGTISASDYTALFENGSDIMFDISTFGIAVVSDTEFDSFSDKDLVNHYSFQYNDSSLSDQQKKSISEDMISAISKANAVTDLTLAENNQGITFVGDDMGSDIPMMKAILYIMIVIMAFVFSVIIGNTIESESSIIGTLLANGYGKHELIRHYMAPALMISLLSALAGNLIGYTLIVGYMKNTYYNSYSLPPYRTYWNADAFLYTTVIPILLLIFITYFSLLRKMSLTPLQFLRKELKGKKVKKAVRLPNFSFLNRFRLRIILQNKSNYVVLFVGIFFASFMLMWGLCINPTIDKYEDDVIHSAKSKYQYILKAPVAYEKTSSNELKDSTSPEKFTMGSMETYYKLAGNNIDVSVYGIEENSSYFKDLDVKNGMDGVYLSENLLKKLNMRIGDRITLHDKYNDKTFVKTVLGTYDYAGSLSVFLSREDLNTLTGKDISYFNAYLSNEELQLPKEYVSSSITPDDMLKLGRQIDKSLGSMVYIIVILSIIVFFVLMYILTKVVIERNAISISFMKVFGYEDKEIDKIYLRSITYTVLASLIVCLPLEVFCMREIFKLIFIKMDGYFEFYMEPYRYLEIIIIGMLSYFVINAFHVKKVRKIKMADALKCRE